MWLQYHCFGDLLLDSTVAGGLHDCRGFNEIANVAVPYSHVSTVSGCLQSQNDEGNHLGLDSTLPNGGLRVL